MSRIKITFPEQFSFTANIPIRITDLNYGNHVGNDAVLSIIHEARMQFLAHHGYSELDLAGTGLIMADAGIEFKKEIFYGDAIAVNIAAVNFTSVGFDLYYQLLNKEKTVTALAKTGMICYDYNRKKIAHVPAEVKEKLAGN
nr:thioesterase family protein [uncultured Lacibacter sp.]